MEPTIYKPSIYKGAGIYKTVAEGGGVETNVISTICNEFVDNKDVPLIGDPSDDLSIFNPTLLNPGYKLNCDSVNAGWAPSNKIYDCASEKINFDSSIIVSFDRGGSYAAYGYSLGPFAIMLADNLAQPISTRDSLVIWLSQVSNAVNLDTNCQWSRESNTYLYVNFGTYTSNKMYNLRIKIDDNTIKVIDILSGKYFSFARSFWSGSFSSVSLRFGTFSTDKYNGQNSNLYEFAFKKIE